MKYEIRVYKIKEKNDVSERDLMLRGIGIERNEQVIFGADMTSDNTIEILQHLYDLKSRKLVD